MKNCEHHEVMISACLDGELDRAEQTEMLDHLVRCADCRSFYVGARRLAGLAVVVGTRAPAEPPSPELWSHIERSVAPPRGARTHAARRWIRRVPTRTWAPAAAAALLLVVVGSLLSREGVPTGASTEVRLGEHTARMNDARFIELTREVLGADRKYRAAFSQIMRQVERDTLGHESSVDVLAPRSEGGEGRRGSETSRVPS